MATTNAAIAEGTEAAKTLVQRVVRSFYDSRQCILLDQLIRREAYVLSLSFHPLRPTHHLVTTVCSPLSYFAAKRARIDKLHLFFGQQNERRRTRWESRNTHQGSLQDCSNLSARSNSRSVCYSLPFVHFEKLIPSTGIRHRRLETIEGAMKAQQRTYYYMDYSHATDVVKWRMYKIQSVIDDKLRNVGLPFHLSDPRSRSQWTAGIGSARLRLSSL